MREIGKQVSNWGRWGDDDEVGTLNLITPEARARGATLARSGKAFTLGVEFGPQGPQVFESPIGRFNPQHYMLAAGTSFGDPPVFRYSDDVVSMPLQAATQWDSLAHVHYDELLYNGYRADQVLGLAGASRNGIDRLAAVPLVTKGVLLDVARLKGVDRLAPSTLVTVEDLDAAVESEGVTIDPGDVVLLRTGHITTFTADTDRATFNWMPPGVGLAAAAWLRERDVAAIAADTPTVEVLPSENPALISPLHLLAIRDMGMPLGEIFDLEALAADCADDGVYEFLFGAQPIGFVGGIGSPVNPVAVK
ncbi:MAG: cyclase family protein [Actinobacteria bacterium]|nr:cyclase family protein [Actinomycetota bacterium]